MERLCGIVMCIVVVVLGTIGLVTVVVQAGNAIWPD